MKIIIADDDPSVLRLLTVALMKRGHEVTGFTSGFGVSTSAHEADLVVLDHHMPALSGLAVLELLGKRFLTRNVPVLIYSADPTIQERIVKVDHPKAIFVLKGSSIMTLIKIIESYAQDEGVLAQR